MIDVKALQGQVSLLVDDLREQASTGTELDAKLRKVHTEATTAERVGVPYETWLEGELDKAAVAWVLSCVFVRYCEDNRLVDRVWIGGPEKHASAERATQALQAYVRDNPRKYEREWLEQAFEHLRDKRATSKIFDEHNPVWEFAISGRAAEDLADFFRRGAGNRSLRTPELSTRFLGDLYEHLSVYAQKTWALRQTPEFVEEFILDRTLEPALKEFGLSGISVIDPTCGSGHFLIGAFERLLKLWRKREPDIPTETHVERVLEQVTGVDINQFAVAIARFRLVVAALKATGRTNLNNSYDVRVATGDSLLRWGGTRSSHQGDLLAELEGRPVFAYYTEDGDLLGEYLRPGNYTVVVGNPPYITVKDPRANQIYRKEYPEVCYRQYALTVPFAKRFFELAKRGDNSGRGAGYVGQITSNSFMKREFGKNLINDYYRNEVELTEIIDTSGAFIPGHGTPTVILVGCNRLVSKRYSEPIRAVLGIRGETSQPVDAARGDVWCAIVKQVDQPGSESQWVSATDVPRNGQFANHPWSLSGGGADSVMAVLEDPRYKRLSTLVDEIGFGAVTREDSAYMLGASVLRRQRIPERMQIPLTEGDATRDWSIQNPTISVWPYHHETLKADADDSTLQLLWPMKRILSERVAYGSTQIERGLAWFEYSMFFKRRYKAPITIAFGEVSTHNHFVLGRGSNVFNRTAPVIKLPKEASEEDHLRLLGVLNSSTACFWMKQVSQDKGIRGEGGGFTSLDWERFYQFNGTKLKRFPVPADRPLEFAKEIDRLARNLNSLLPARIVATTLPTRESLDRAHFKYMEIRNRMIALQEELDWQIYDLYRLLDEQENPLVTMDPPELELGQRAFEILLARKSKSEGADDEWFTRHGSKPIIKLPEHWPAKYRELVGKRIAILELNSNRIIGMIERPEYKRRWASESWKSMEQAALRDWLLDELEQPMLWGGAPAPLSIAQLADKLRHEEDFRSVLNLWVGTDQHDLEKTLSKLVTDEYVPFLSADRYKQSGLRKRALWERTWRQQRREDTGEDIRTELPPKYVMADFAKGPYWRNRGKLDVPHERFIAYPGMGRDGDRTLLLGWAGWDHLAQARALVAVYLHRKKQEAWPAERLLPLLAGLLELEPWLHQWHNEPQPGFPGSPADFFSGLIDNELSTLGTDRQTLIELRGVEELE